MTPTRPCAVCGLAPSRFRCGRCAEVYYCSRRHQRQAYAEHKTRCVALDDAAAAAMATARKAADAEATTNDDDDDALTCWVCLDETAPLYRASCACRGRAGAAHLECWISQARAAYARARDASSYDKCPTCRVAYGSASVVQLALYYSFWCDQTTNATPQTTTTLESASRFGYAVASVDPALGLRVLRRCVDEAERREGAASTNCLLAKQVYAEILKRHGDAREALRLCDELYGVFRATCGEDHPHTVGSKLGLAACYEKFERYGEAEALCRDVARRLKVLEGPEHIATLRAATHLATLLAQQGKAEEVLAVVESLGPVAARVLGPDHDLTLKIDHLARRMNHAARRLGGSSSSASSSASSSSSRR